jgi:ribosomal protein S18 acetylase RimI-like enzyme
MMHLDTRTLETEIANPFFDSLKADYPDFAAWVSRLHDDADNRRIFYIPVPSQKTIEFAGLAIIKLDEPNFTYLLDQPVSKISTFKIADELAGNGYATKLLNAILDELEINQTRTVYLEVGADHLNTIAFFAKNDFQVLSTIGIQEDTTVVMVRAL